MLKAILFDCDGVLVDTEGLKMLAWNRALRKYGVQISESVYAELVGYSSQDIINKVEEIFSTKLNSQEIIQSKRAYYSQLHAKGVPGIGRQVQLIHKLLSMRTFQGCNLKVGVVSSDSVKNIELNLEAIEVQLKDLDVVVSGRDHLPEGLNKPHPAIYLEAASRISVQPRNCLVIEDTPAGCTAAGKAGMCVLATPNVYTKQLEFPPVQSIIDPSQESISLNCLFKHYSAFTGEPSLRRRDSAHSYPHGAVLAKRRKLISDFGRPSRASKVA